MHEEQEQVADNSGEGQDAAPVDGSSVPPLQDEVVVEETVEPTEDDETKPDADPPESNQTD